MKKPDTGTQRQRLAATNGTKRYEVGTRTEAIRQQVKDKAQAAATVAMSVASPAVTGGVLIGNVLLSPHLSSSIENAALRLPEMVGGKSGTTRPIADLVGVANEYASRAWWGNGPLSNGGSGMAGGDARRTAVATTVIGVGVVGVAAAAILLEAKKQRDEDARKQTVANACPTCQTPMSGPVEGDGFTLGPRCPKGNHDRDQEDQA